MSDPTPTLIRVPTVSAVRAQFASRPTLENATRQALASAIAEKYPTLEIDLSRARLATPDSDGTWSLSPLMPRVLDYLASGTKLDLRPRFNRPFYLSSETGDWLAPADGSVDMQVIEALIEELPWRLPIVLQSVLSDYWSEASDAGDSRWRWFSDVLKDTLSICAVRQQDLGGGAREMIDQIIQCPERAERMRRYSVDATYAYCLEITLGAQGDSSPYLSPTLVLARARQVLLCHPDGQVRTFSFLDEAIRDETQRINQTLAFEQIQINRYEPDGNLFDTQAAIILDRQLERLGALQLPARVGLQALQAVYTELTDPALALLDAPQVSAQALDTLRAAVPAWLQQAPLADQATYRRYSLELALAKKSSQGRTFLTGIADIHQFTVEALTRQMQQDQARLETHLLEHIPGAMYHPDDIELTFQSVIGSPGTLGNPSPVGIVERVTMSLTELALKNLSGRPQGHVILRHRLGLALPAWLTPEYITRRGGLIEQVDIGRVYPQQLQAMLLGDTPDALKREQLFSDQVSVQLPLQALESSLKDENGLSPLGARYVAALMHPEARGREVEGVPIVIRHLALLRKPDARPDVVSNMFVIEPVDQAVGPHLLYRPLYSPALHEFSSRAALLDAIATPGALQTSVLIWLSDLARPIYANGGFQEPHYVRFGQGSDFSTLETPLPASLATDGASDELLQSLQYGKLLEFLYGSNARALVDQANRESVSNSESRWEVLLEGGGLIFNTLLLPVLRGPAMLTGWLLSLIASAVREIPALHSTDPIQRELAMVDLLLNLGMLLFQMAPGGHGGTVQLDRGIRQQVVRARAPERVAEQWPVPPLPGVIDGTVALAGELPRPATTTLDFSFASARHRLTPGQRARLSRFQVQPSGPLPAPSLDGIYVIDQKRHVRVNGNLYRVDSEAGGGLVIVDPNDINLRGPGLQWANGQWTLDLGLRLRGGMPPKRLAALRQQKAERKHQLQAEYDQFLAQQATQQQEIDIAQSVMERAAEDPRFTAEQRATFRQRFNNLLQKQTAVYQQLLESHQERTELQIPIPVATRAILMENLINNARKSVVISELNRKAHYEKGASFNGRGPELEKAIAAHHEQYPEYVKELVEINERSIHWLEVKDRWLAELYELGEAGVERYTRLTRDRPVEEMSALCVKGMQLHAIVLPCIKVWERTLPESLNALLEPMQEQVRTHTDLDALDFTTSERLEVLSSLVERYGRVLDALQGIAIVNVDELDHAYFNRLLKLVEDLYQNVARQLEVAMKPAVETRRPAPKRTPHPVGAPHKRVIRTRHRGRLIGQTRQPTRDWPLEVVEIRSEYNNELLATYSRHGDVWDEVQGLKPAEVRPAARPLDQIKGEARKLFSQLDNHVKRADSYSKISRYPQELEEVLAHEAERLEHIATELEQAIQATAHSSRQEADLALVNDMRAGAARMAGKGRELRTQASLDLPPTHGNLQHLLEHDLVQIARLGERIALRGERRDFIQEYAINHKGGAPLWYAHFHYTAVDTPKQNYTVAHLKTAAQRKQSYYTLLSDAQSSQAAVNVHRGQIGKDLAQRWFLPLAP